MPQIVIAFSRNEITHPNLVSQVSQAREIEIFCGLQIGRPSSFLQGLWASFSFTLTASLLCLTNLASCVARRQLCQTRLLSCVARRPLSQTISNLLPNEEQMRPALPREISGLTSHDRINTMGGVYTPVHALMNNTWRCTVFSEGNLSEASVKVVVSKSTEKIGCSFVNSETKSNYIHGIFLHTSSCYFSILKGGMVPDNVSYNSPWACLTERLAHLNLVSRVSRARRDPGKVWSGASVTIKNTREGSSLYKEFVTLSFVEFKARLIASRCGSAITRDVLQ